MADELAKRAEARVGRWLHQKWKLDRLIGVGGMAAVYAATHRNGKRGAVKLLHLELSLEQDVRERFLREGYLANKVGHPGAVAVLDDDVAEDGSIYLVMELLEGTTLISLLEKQPNEVMGLHAALGVIEQLLDILASAHKAGIVHRDVKPENIFVTTDGRVKLLDFGIARLRETQSEWRTRTGHAMGTPAFMPPEQAAGKWAEVGPHSDVWAVGATLFNMLTGRTVHEAETVPILMVKAITMPAPALTSVLPEVPPDVAVLVDRAIAFEPTARFASADAMRAAVKACLARHHGPSLVSLLADDGAPMAAPDTSEALTLPETKTLVDEVATERAPRPRRGSGVLVKALAGAAALSVVLGTGWYLVASGDVRGDASSEVPPAVSSSRTQQPEAPPSVAPPTAELTVTVSVSVAPQVSARPAITSTGIAPRPTAKPAASPDPYELRKTPK